MCRLCLSANGITEPICYDQRDQFLMQKIYECTTLQVSVLGVTCNSFCRSAYKCINEKEKIKTRVLGEVRWGRVVTPGTLMAGGWSVDIFININYLFIQNAPSVHLGVFVCSCFQIEIVFSEDEPLKPGYEQIWTH